MKGRKAGGFEHSIDRDFSMRVVPRGTVRGMGRGGEGSDSYRAYQLEIWGPESREIGFDS